MRKGREAKGMWWKKEGREDERQLSGEEVRGGKM